MLTDCNWEVNSQDVMAGAPNIARYYTPTASRARCINCNERGHLARDCPQPKVKQLYNYLMVAFKVGCCSFILPLPNIVGFLAFVFCPFVRVTCIRACFPKHTHC